MNFQDKIHSSDSLRAWREALRAQGKSLAATNGCFDILHAGHVNYLQAARNEAGALIVGLNSDRSVSELKGPDRPIHSEADRAAEAGRAAGRRRSSAPRVNERWRRRGGTGGGSSGGSRLLGGCLLGGSFGKGAETPLV